MVPIENGLELKMACFSYPKMAMTNWLILQKKKHQWERMKENKINPDVNAYRAAPERKGIAEGS